MFEISDQFQFRKCFLNQHVNSNFVTFLMIRLCAVG